jgi:Fic family protein
MIMHPIVPFDDSQQTEAKRMTNRIESNRIESNRINTNDL